MQFHQVGADLFVPVGIKLDYAPLLVVEIEILDVPVMDEVSLVDGGPFRGIGDGDPAPGTVADIIPPDDMGIGFRVSRFEFFYRSRHAEFNRYNPCLLDLPGFEK